MESALGWIGQIFDAILRFFPRLLVIRSTEFGVKFVYGKHPVPMAPGLHFYWPLVTEYVCLTVVRQTFNLPNQTVVKSNGQAVGVSGIVVYEIVDAFTLLTETHSWEGVINDYALGAIADAIESQSGRFVDRKMATDHVRVRLRKALRKLGVRVIMVKLTDIAPLTLVVGHWNTTDRMTKSE